MAHTIERAPSGRARCRGCGTAIARDAWRLGERLPNPFAEGEMTHWYHPRCAAYKRPEPLLEALAAGPGDVADGAALEAAARRSLEHRRLPRIDGVERAPTGKARCRSCREPIARDAFRVRLAYFEDGRFAPGGFVHLGCRAAYFETDDILERLLHFSPGLPPGDREEVEGLLGR